MDDMGAHFFHGAGEVDYGPDDLDASTEDVDDNWTDERVDMWDLGADE